MKNLFEVNGKFFPRKSDAKAYRDTAHTGAYKKAPVRLGPDHMRYKGAARSIGGVGSGGTGDGK